MNSGDLGLVRTKSTSAELEQNRRDRPKGKTPRGRLQPFRDPRVARVFARYEPDVKAALLAIRALIFRIAHETDGVGRIEEALRWGQPSYLTTESGSGSMVRLDAVRAAPGEYALYFHCQTTLVSSFREKFGRRLRYEGNRALLFRAADEVPSAEVEDCVRQALTYHQTGKPVRPIGERMQRRGRKTDRAAEASDGKFPAA